MQIYIFKRNGSSTTISKTDFPKFYFAAYSVAFVLCYYLFNFAYLVVVLYTHSIVVVICELQCKIYLNEQFVLLWIFPFYLLWQKPKIFLKKDIW